MWRDIQFHFFKYYNSFQITWKSLLNTIKDLLILKMWWSKKLKFDLFFSLFISFTFKSVLLYIALLILVDEHALKIRDKHVSSDHLFTCAALIILETTASYPLEAAYPSEVHLLVLPCPLCIVHGGMRPAMDNGKCSKIFTTYCTRRTMVMSLLPGEPTNYLHYMRFVRRSLIH